MKGRILRVVAAVAASLAPVAAFATTSDFTAPTGFDPTSLFTAIVMNNKSMILGGAAGVTFLWLGARILRAFRSGSTKMVK